MVKWVRDTKKVMNGRNGRIGVQIKSVHFRVFQVLVMELLGLL